MRRIVSLVITLGACASLASAQSPMPPPSGPVAFCGVQSTPAASSWKVIFDNGQPEDVSMVTPTSEGSGALVAFCNANAPGWTHAFTLPPTRFTLGDHTVAVDAINQFGTFRGPVWTVPIGMKPGAWTTKAVGQLPQD